MLKPPHGGFFFGEMRLTGTNLALALCFAGILVLGIVLGWPALSGPFLFDDFPNLQQLAALDGQLTWDSLGKFLAQSIGAPGRPLSMLSFVINDAAWPSDPWGFKYTNLLLHALISVLVFGLARALAGYRLAGNAPALAALITMAAWLLHPMQLSTTMLVVQRMTQLSALFALAALWGYVAMVRHAGTNGKALSAIAILGVGSMLAVLCKENGVLVPLLAVVLNVTLLQRHLASLPVTSRRILQLGTTLPMVGLLLAIAWRWPGFTDYSSRAFDLGERLLSQPRALVDYAYKILVPNLRGGGIFHDDFEVSRGLLQPATTLPALLVVAALAVASLFFRRRWPLFSFSVLWFLAAHALESTVFPLELYFEHRNYVAMLGPLAALAMFVAAQAHAGRRIALVVAVAWISYAAWLTSVQAPIWGDRGKLVTVWALERPSSPRSTQLLADYLYREGRPDAAASTLTDAYAHGVRGSDFPLQVHYIACVHGTASMQDQFIQLARVLRDAEYNHALFATLSKLREAVGVDACPGIATPTSVLALTDVLLRNPNYQAPGARAYLHIERAYLYTALRDLDPTMHELETAYAIGPTIRLSQLMAATLLSAGLDEAAIAVLADGLQKAPDGLREVLSGERDDSLRAIRGIRERAPAQAGGEVAPQ